MLLYKTLENKRDFLNKNIGETSLNLLDNTFLVPDEFEFNLIEVTAEYIARPDLLSRDIYGDDMYTDIICKLNGISNPFELNEGMVLMIPMIDSIDKFNTPSDIGESIYDDNIKDGITDTPRPKKKNDKRKANEAIVGDKRFNIDLSKNIVIY